MVIKHSTVHNPNEIVPSADWNADHTGTASPEAHTLASHSTKAHAELTNVTSDQHHAQSHTLASHSTKAHAELTNVTSDQHHAQSHNMASHTDDYSAGGGIDISVGNVISGEDSTAANKGIVIVAAGEGMNVGYAAGTATISGEDATTANKGIASFNTFDFSVAAGAVSLDDDIISTISGDAGTATGLGHNINILGGEGINTAGLNDDVTISGEDATIANKGIASFNTLNFSVAGGAVSLGAQGINLNMNTHQINGVVDPTLDQDAATKKYVDDLIPGPGTSYWSCPGSGFMPNDWSEDYIYINHRYSCLEIQIVKTPVYLPNGAVVTACVVYGSNAAKLWYLTRGAIADGNAVATMATANINTEDNSISVATIDNANYTYAITTNELANGNDIDGARITYTL